LLGVSDMKVGTLAKAGRDGVLYPKAEALGCGGSSLCPGPCAVLGMDVRDWYTMSCAWVLCPKAEALGCDDGLVSPGPCVVLCRDVRRWYAMSCVRVALYPKAEALGCGGSSLCPGRCVVLGMDVRDGMVYPARWGCVPRLKPWVVMMAWCVPGLVWCLV